MLQIVIDRIINVSSEDPMHAATNIFSTDSTKIWKCQPPGIKEAIIVLQLKTPTVISEIEIGNENSAYIEVLVNRSVSLEKKFQVLLNMVTFMTPKECKETTDTNKVRTFKYGNLKSSVRDQKWDQIQIICTQPFNRRVQYGLSFIKFYSSDSKQETATTTTKIGNFTLRASSPDKLAVGNLFARRKESVEETSKTDHPLLHGASSATDLHQVSPKNNSPKEKQETQLKVASEKKIQKETQVLREHKQNAKRSSNAHSDLENKRKLDNKGTPHKKAKPTTLTKPFNELLSGVTFVISGIENPERSTIRTEALTMGAKYKSDWENSCTHLVCAFTNTPKFTQVKGKGKIVNRKWIADCHTQRKRLPWRRYALDSKDKTKNESEDEILEKQEEESEDTYEDHNDGTDTEDEIERIQSSSRTSDKVQTDDEAIEFVRDKKTVSEDLFSGKALYLDKKLSKTATEKLKEYIVTCKGLVVDDPSDAVDYVVTLLDSTDTVKALFPKARIVSTDWIWSCQNTKRRVSDDSYNIAA